MTGSQAFGRAIGIAIVTAAVFVGIAPPCFAQATAPPGGPSESITVHGDWIIVVRNPDGSIASRHEFRNSLGPDGGMVLTRILGRTLTPGQWVVRLDNALGAPDPCDTRECSIAEPVGVFGAHSRDLTVTVPTSGPNAGMLVLQGSVTVLTAAALQEVSTEFLGCLPNEAPAACGGAFGTATFTHKTLPSAVPVQPGQTVDVTVVISFS